MSPYRSARIRQRRHLTRTVSTVTNRCIYTLNCMYHSKTCLTPPPPLASTWRGRSQPSPHLSPKQVNPSSPPQSVPRYSTPPLAAARSRHHSTVLSAFATRQQQRLVASLRLRCASFVLTVRSSAPVTTAEPSVGKMSEQDQVDRILSSYSFTDDIPSHRAGSPDQTTYPHSFEGSLSLRSQAASSHGDATAASLPRSPAVSTAPTAVVPLIASRVALPDSLHIVPLLGVLPPEQALLYSDALHGAPLMRSPMEILALDLTLPLQPPRVAGSRSEYLALIRRMFKIGMLAFTASPKAVNGVFTVGKDADQDRLIIDAQPANRLFQDSPHVALPDPSHLVQLRIPSSGPALVVGKSDLSNFYLSG